MGQGKKAVILVGMNPGPWGMAQTGVPFGEVAAAKDWLRVETAVGTPSDPHPKRPVTGFDCRRSEVSGRRLWGLIRSRFGTPQRFFEHFFVANYCPLMFLEESGRNRTPNQIPMARRKPLLAACDRALVQTATLLEPQHVIGIGKFASQRIAIALSQMAVGVGGITHPSPANPKANRGWEALVIQEFAQIGIDFQPQGA